MNNIAIKVEKLSKSYSGNKVLNNLSFTVKKGKVFGILGANGAGKSTSIECILGIQKADEGFVEILGMNPINNRRKLFQQVGVQFQESNYQREIKVCELCEEMASIYEKPNNWRELLNEFGISNKEKSLVKNLSGGERQRLFIILALISNPQIVFLDELTTGLDAKARRCVWSILEKLKEKGLTIILTSHFMDEVEALCDKILILKHGETIFYGTVSEAINNSPYEKFEDSYLWYSCEEDKNYENN